MSDFVTNESIVVGMLFLTLGLGIGVLVMLVVDAEVLGSSVDVAVPLAPLVVHYYHYHH